VKDADYGSLTQQECFFIIESSQKQKKLNNLFFVLPVPEKDSKWSAKSWFPE
jgi:hypothetical protein